MSEAMAMSLHRKHRKNALSVRIMSGDHRARYFAALSATGMSNQLPEDRGQLMISQTAIKQVCPPRMN